MHTWALGHRDETSQLALTNHLSTYWCKEREDIHRHKVSLTFMKGNQRCLLPAGERCAGARPDATAYTAAPKRACSPKEADSGSASAANPRSTTLLAGQERDQVNQSQSPTYSPRRVSPWRHSAVPHRNQPGDERALPACFPGTRTAPRGTGASPLESLGTRTSYP